MKFEKRKFSKRFPEIECSVFVLHEKPYAECGHCAEGFHYRATGAAIILPSGSVYVGVTLCSPADQYVRKVGRAKAIGRAYQAARQGLEHAVLRIALYNSQQAMAAASNEVRELIEEKIREAKKRAAEQALALGAKKP